MKRSSQALVPVSLFTVVFAAAAWLRPCTMPKADDSLPETRLDMTRARTSMNMLAIRPQSETILRGSSTATFASVIFIRLNPPDRPKTK